MTRTRSLICTAYTVLFLALCAVALRDKACWFALPVLAVQVLVYALMPSRTMLSFSASHLPALSMLLLLKTGNPVWLWVLLALSAVLVGLRLLTRLPQPRSTTDLWVGSLLLAEVLAVVVTIL